MPIKISLHIIRIVFLTSFLVGQDPYYIPIKKSKTFPSNSVYNMLQDSKGYMWFAHNAGLTRYDGYEFKTYTCLQQTSQAGTCIREDKYGRIWYENFDGYIYYIQNDTMYPLQQKKPLGYIDFGMSENKLFVVVKNEVIIYALNDLKVQTSVALPFEYVNGTCVLNNNFYIAGNTYFYIDENNRWHEIKHQIKNERLIPFQLQSSGHAIFVVSKFNEFQTCFEFCKGKLQAKFPLKGLNFIQTSFYADSCYWFCTTKGAFAFNEKGLALNNGKPFFEDKNITGVLKDREGNFWFSTSNEGILFVPDLETKLLFKGIQASILDYENQTLFIGTRKDEVFTADLKYNTLKEVFNGHSNHEVYFLKYDSISKQIVFSSDAFFKLNLEGKILYDKRIAIKDCQRVNTKYFLYAASGAIGLIEENKNSITEWDSLHKKNSNAYLESFSDLITGCRGKSVYYDSLSKCIYAAAGTGLYKITPKGSEEIKWQGESVFSIKVAGYKNKIFVLSSNGKLLQLSYNNIIDYTNPIFRNENNFKSLRICGKYMLLKNSATFYCVDLETNQAFEQASLEENVTDALVQNNYLFLASGDGILRENLNLSNKRKVSPLLNFNAIKCDDINFNSSVVNTFSYKQNNIDINYSILSFKTGSRFPLYYRVNDEKWELTEPESRTLKLASLSPGNYKIDFILGDPNSNQFQVKSIRFFINKPWWLTWWMFAFYLSFIFLLFYLVYRWRTKELIKKNKFMTEKMELENALNRSILTSIKSQMNPHFFHNALNTIQSFIYTDDKKNASAFLTKFSKLTRMILEMSEKEKVTLKEEILAITLYLDIEKVRFNDDFDFRVNIAADLDVEMIKIPSMIIQPYIENAVKHGLLHKKGEKKLEIDFSIEQNYLVVRIDDNGIGRKMSDELNRIKKEKHQSFATVANEKRLILLNRGNSKKVGVEYTDKTDSYSKASGTRVIISIPIILP